VNAGADGPGACGLVRAGGARGAGGELAAGDGGVQGDDVLGIDQPGGAGGGDDLARVIAQPGGRGVLAVMTARTPPGRSTRSHAVYSTPVPGPSRPVMARAARPASGQPASSSRAGPPARACASGRAAGSRPWSRRALAAWQAAGPANSPRTRRPAAAAADRSAPVPAGMTTSSPGRENAVMTCAVSGPGPGTGQGAGQTLTGTPIPGPAAVPGC
jgi:hypothetical protein